MATTYLASFEITDALVPKLTSATVCAPLRDVTDGAPVRFEAAVCRDRARVHGVTALQRLIRRIRSMKVSPEDNVNPSGGKIVKICGRYGGTTLNTCTACTGMFGVLQCVRQ